MPNVISMARMRRGLPDRPRRGRVAGLLAACALACAGATAALPAQASAADAGVNILNLNVPGQAGEVGSLGTHWVRLFATWNDLEPQRGVWAQNWFGYYEGEFASLPAGTKVILDVVGTPRWETGSSNEHLPPANDGEYAAFLGQVARHFGSRVAAYEIWNEEDAARWWAPGPDAAAYTRMLQAAYPAIKAAEPNATVVLGGLTGNDYEFLEKVYQAGGKGFFDAVGVHDDTACNIASPYEFLRWESNGRIMDDSFLAYREVRATMLANGDDKPIWMTELSWRTTSNVCSEGFWAGKKPEGVTEQVQAKFLLEAYHCLAQDPYVQVALWFPLQDQNGVHNGLVRAGGQPKLSFAAMQEYTRFGDRLTEPCGTFTGPQISVGSPGNGRSWEGPLPIHVTAHSAYGVWRIRLVMDGRLIRNFDNLGYPSTLTGVINWMGAKHVSHGWHTLTILTYDKMHNVSQVTVRVFHGRIGGAKPRKHARKHRRSKHHGHG
jgi:hypothetical protein